MNKEPVIRFEKVSFDQYLSMFRTADDDLTDEEVTAIRNSYNNIKLPSRGTPGSAGYDFVMPFDMCYNPEQHESVMVPTGIRVYMDPGYVLLIFSRSGLGTKYGMRLTNTIGVIDSDYYYANNEGHIICSISADKPFNIREGERFMQGLCFAYYTTTNDKPREHRRTGGFGSTDGKANK